MDTIHDFPAGIMNREHQRALIVKHLFDRVVALAALLVLGIPFLACVVVMKCRGYRRVFFFQTRIGRYGKPFTIIKLRTMVESQHNDNTVTTAADARITPVGKVLRTLKIDEFPQLINIVLGRMSFVGPRPDVPGYADKLTGEDRLVLSVRAGITSPASIFFKREEEILKGVDNPVAFNDTVIWPIKVRMNKEYVRNRHFFLDIGYIIVTLVPALDRVLQLVGTIPTTPFNRVCTGQDRTGRQV